jgi:hypothetical protein
MEQDDVRPRSRQPVGVDAQGAAAAATGRGAGNQVVDLLPGGRSVSPPVECATIAFTDADRRPIQPPKGGRPVLDLMAAGFTGFCLGWLFARTSGMPARHRRGL